MIITMAEDTLTCTLMHVHVAMATHMHMHLVFNTHATPVLSAGLHISPDTVMGVFLLNPLTIATCIAGTTSSAYICCCIAVLCLAYHRRWLATAVLLALATYQDPQAALLLVSPCFT